MLRMKRVQLNIDRDFECVSMAQMPLPENILVEKKGQNSHINLVIESKMTYFREGDGPFFFFFANSKNIIITGVYIIIIIPMGDSSQFSPLNTLSEQLGPNSWVSSDFIPAFIANIGKHFFLTYDSNYSKSI